MHTDLSTCTLTCTIHRACLSGEGPEICNKLFHIHPYIIILVFVIIWEEGKVRENNDMKTLEIVIKLKCNLYLIIVLIMNSNNTV